MTVASGPLPVTTTNWLRRAMRRGEPVVLVSSSRCVIVTAADTADVKSVAVMVRRSSGFLRVVLPSHVCDRLHLPESHGFPRADIPAALGQCVAVDAADGVTTGISAGDRARTARLLASPESTPDDFHRPGHLVPVRVPSLSGIDDELDAAALRLTAEAVSNPGALLADVVSPVDECRMATAQEAAAVATAEKFALCRLGEDFAVAP